MKRLCLLLSLLLSSFVMAGENTQPSDPVRVAFINPAPVGHPFWDLTTGLMQVAADDLNIDLNILHANGDRFLNTELALNLLVSDEKPDYLIFNYFFSQGIRVLMAAEKVGVNTILINTDIPERDLQITGLPQTQLKHWLARIMPDDFRSGGVLAQLLTDRAHKDKLTGDDGLAHMIAVSGMRDSTAAIARSEGLKQTLAGNPDVQLEQLVFANWSEDMAGRQTLSLLARYPQTTLIWSASDAMALAAADSVRQHRKVPGEDVYLAGFDWSSDGLNAVEDGTLLASIGGQFLDGALALVMVYDHARGINIPEKQRNTYRQLDVINKQNIGRYRHLLSRENWGDMRFKRLTLSDGARSEYLMDTRSVLTELVRR